MSTAYKIFMNKYYPPQPSTKSYEGKTVLITGTSSGLGLAGAKQLAALGASTLIVTARNEEKVAIVKKDIESFLESQPLKTSNRVEIVTMTLGMSSKAEVQSFVKALKAKFQHLDHAILNAGTIQTQHSLSPDGWEETIQVNAINTLLLGLLILPLLLASPSVNAPDAADRPHLNFISSSTAEFITPASMEPFKETGKPIRALSEEKNFPTGMMGGQGQYARSKVILEYGMRRMAQLPVLRSSPDDKPKVIITSCCPGMCKSDLGRQFMTNIVLRVVATVGFTLFGRTAEQGSNTYLTALELDETMHGKAWRNDTVLEQKPMMTTDEGKEFGEVVWKELSQVLIEADPGVKELLST